MTRTHFDQALERLEQSLLRLGARATEAIHQALDALARQDLDLAEKITSNDDMIDDMTLEIEEECIRLIALQQPIAKDLRIITTVLKTSTDLERIADHATNIAEITMRIGRNPLIKPLVDLPNLAIEVEKMVHSALEAFVSRDIEKAKQTCIYDDVIDKKYEELFIELTEFIRTDEDKDRVVQALNLLFVARFLERVGDHATNIGERVIYLVTGENANY
ncbi:MAG TPA: phosphate signaling complex protein PhoU [Bacillota bacterium]|nr:phosphate signaling complex protein PhoU [Bacillota bacterium]